MKINMLNIALGAVLLPVSMPAQNRPNVVFMISDQHQINALGCYGSKNLTVDQESPTPNIDRLAKRGIVFNNTYTPSPLSAPARASIITGTYPHTHTALRHKENGLEPGHHRYPGILPNMTTIAEAFRSAGYATAAIGKVHVHGELSGVNDLGFDHSDLRFYTYYPGAHYADRGNGDWVKRYREMGQYNGMTYNEIDAKRFSQVPNDVTPKKNHNNQNYLETIVEHKEQMFDWLVAEESIAYIERQAKQEKPFFLYVGFEKPHEPYTVHKRYLDMFDPQQMILPPTWNESTKNKGRLPFVMKFTTYGEPDEKSARNTTAAYYACIREMDEQLGRILDKCDELGIAENTIFVYTTDHGDNMYTHSMQQKHSMFEMSARVPMVISYPAVLPAGVFNSDLSTLIDLTPTLLELSDIPTPKTFEGVSLLKNIEGKTGGERTVFSEFYEAHKDSYSMFPDAKIMPMKMCRYKNYKYIYTHGMIEQLYDLKEDPDELNNLVLTSPSEYQSITDKLRLSVLDDWTIDARPTFDVNMNRSNGELIFSWDKVGCMAEYILYRSQNGDPLTAVEIARGESPCLKDIAPLREDACYWVVAMPEFTRKFYGATQYRDRPIATTTLPVNIPASRRMYVNSSLESAEFNYHKHQYN